MDNTEMIEVQDAPFQITMSLDKDFVREFKRLSRKYGEQVQRINGFAPDQLNFTGFIDNFVDSTTVADVTIDGNANSGTKDIVTMQSDMKKPHTKLLSFNKVFYEMRKKYGLDRAKKWLEDEWNGALYMHDAHNCSLIPYCYAYDLDEVAERGLFFINRFKTGAPQHLDTFNKHVLEFVSWTSNRQSGAVGLPSYLIYSFYFWKKDVENGYYTGTPERYRDQQFQAFIYDLNQPYLRLTECAFTNVSIFDREYLMGLFGGREYPDGSLVVDYIEELIEYQKAFMKVVSEIRSETMMTFPVLTMSLLFQNGKFVDEDFARWCNKHNMKWCDSNFFVGNDVTTLSNCCRLLSDTTKVKASGFINSIGGTSLKIGSVKVSTINLHRVALEADGDKNKFFKILSERTKLDIEVLDIVRGIIKRNIEKNLLPQYSFGLMNLDTQYNTIGVTALYECVEEFGGIGEDEFGNKFYTEEGLDFAVKVLDCIKSIKDSYDFDYSINIEAVPAESANVKLCYKDNLLYPEKDKGYFIFSNQWIPLMQKCTLQEKIRLGSVLDKACEGGVIAHINLAGEFADEEQAWNLLNYIANEGVIYFAYNKEISVCEEEHGFFGDICPKCGKHKVDTFCRVVGFLTPRSSYSKERKKEFDSRQWFELKD